MVMYRPTGSTVQVSTTLASSAEDGPLRATSRKHTRPTVDIRRGALIIDSSVALLGAPEPAQASIPHRRSHAMPGLPYAAR